MIAPLVYQISYRNLKPFTSYRGLKHCNSDTYAHTHTHTHTSGRQLKITFLDVLDYSEYSDTNISKFFFSRKHSFLNEEAKYEKATQKYEKGVLTCGILWIQCICVMKNMISKRSKLDFSLVWLFFGSYCSHHTRREIPSPQRIIYYYIFFRICYI